jgi:hypothetical protein
MIRKLVILTAVVVGGTVAAPHVASAVQGAAGAVGITAPATTAPATPTPVPTLTAPRVSNPTDSPPTWPWVTYHPPAGWSEAECNQSVMALAWDAALDGSQGGPFYAAMAAHWTTLEGWIYTACQTATPLSQSDIGVASEWVATAVLTHYWDVRHGGSASWDDRWVGYYGTIEGMLTAEAIS